MIRVFAETVDYAAFVWCEEHGRAFPATRRTIKPAGTTSKLFGLTEGAHLPPMREYLRWVQFRIDDPLVAQYAAEGYPVRGLKTYEGTVIVGFPTKPQICDMGEVVTAPEATPEEQFRWLELLEKHWLGTSGGNQVSYTLKYDPTVVSFEDYTEIMTRKLPGVRAVSVMPFADMTAYEYQPEEPISRERFENLVRGTMKEDVGLEHVACEGGACPVDFIAA
jgi:hypothetical protein